MEHYKEVALQIGAIKADTLMDSVRGILRYAGVTGNMAFCFSEIRTVGLCKTAERVRNWAQEKKNTQAERSVERAGQEMLFFW